MYKKLLPLLVLLSCSDADLQSAKGGLPLANGSVATSPSKDSAPEAAKSPAESSNQTAEIDEKATPPSRISGAYLRCEHIEEPSDASAEIGCNFRTSEGSKAAVDPANFEISLDEASQANPDIVARKASSISAAYIVLISVKAEVGQLQGVLDSLSIKVKDLFSPGDVTYSLPEIVSPAELAPAADIPAQAPIICGASGDSCYSDAEAMARGQASTPSGKTLEYVTARIDFKVWKEVGSQRVLKADGSDNWAKKLNADGRGFASGDFVAYDSISGRTCPPNVYIDENDKFSVGKCLYHGIHAIQRLDSGGTNGTLGLSTWTVPLWYAGNIATCSTLGMRLPTVYEAMDSAGENTAAYPYSNGTPQFAGAQAIPTTNYTWTATSYVLNRNQYMVWSPGNVASYDTQASVMCVLP